MNIIFAGDMISGATNRYDTYKWRENGNSLVFYVVRLYIKIIDQIVFFHECVVWIYSLLTKVSKRA